MVNKLKRFPVKWVQVFIGSEEEFRLLYKWLAKFKEVNLTKASDELTAQPLSVVEYYQTQ